MSCQNRDKLDVLQLATGTEAGGTHIIILQLSLMARNGRLPSLHDGSPMRELLEDLTVKFAGRNVGGDIARLIRTLKESVRETRGSVLAVDKRKKVELGSGFRKKRVTTNGYVCAFSLCSVFIDMHVRFMYFKMVTRF